MGFSNVWERSRNARITQFSTCLSQAHRYFASAYPCASAFGQHHFSSVDSSYGRKCKSWERGEHHLRGLGHWGKDRKESFPQMWAEAGRDSRRRHQPFWPKRPQQDRIMPQAGRVRGWVLPKRNPRNRTGRRREDRKKGKRSWAAEEDRPAALSKLTGGDFTVSRTGIVWHWSQWFQRMQELWVQTPDLPGAHRSMEGSSGMPPDDRQESMGLWATIPCTSNHSNLSTLTAENVATYQLLWITVTHSPGQSREKSSLEVSVVTPPPKWLAKCICVWSWSKEHS